MDKDGIHYQCLTNEQLVDKTAGLLRILEQRLERKQSLCSQTVQNLMSEREKLKTVNSIIDQLQGLVSSGSAQGFVFGLITENKIWNASSNNLSGWWNENVNFKRNCPRVLASETCESLGLDALNDLQDPTLSSIISVLMPHCCPAQRTAPFHGETPVAWWPKGTEEWWGRVNILKDSGPPEYKKPRNLRKNAKIAVLIAIIKNLEPNISKIRSLVSDSETLQNKMNQREKYIWLAVLRGEEIRNPYYQRCSSANTSGNSGIESNNCYIAGKNVEVGKVDDGGIGDNLINIINSPLFEKGENTKKIIASGKLVIDTESSISTRPRGLISKKTNVNEPKEVNGRLNPNGEFIAQPEQVQVSKKNSSTSSQSSFLVKKDMASKSENTKKQKLIGIVNPDPKRLKLPYWNRALRLKSHDMQGYVNIDNQIQHNSQTIYGALDFTSLSKTDDHPTVESSFRPNTNENNNMERSDFNEPGAVDKSLNSTLMQGSADNRNHEFQTYNSTSNPSSISEKNFDLGKNITYQPIARGQNTTYRQTDSVNSLNYSITANQSSANLNPQLQHQLLLNSAKHGSVYINPQSQDWLNSFTKKQGSRDPKTQLQNQFESSSSSYPILESSHGQITENERVSDSLISTEQGINYGEDLDSGKTNDVETTMAVENAMDSDAAAESGLQDFEFDGLAVELNAFCALDSFDSNNLDGLF